MWQTRFKGQTRSKGERTTRQKKTDKLVSVFNEWVRRRDCGNGLTRCISCGKPIRFEDCDCGHYINCGNWATKFDEQNCNAQCRSCNRFKEGNIQGYRQGLIAKIGQRSVEMLEIKKHNTCHLSEVELDILIAIYSKKLNKLKC